jgi:VanZ family protein
MSTAASKRCCRYIRFSNPVPLPYILLTGLYCFLIFHNSSVADPLPVTIDIPLGDKFAHVVVFGGLCALISLGMSRGPTQSWRVRATVPVVFTALYGLSDEIHQYFVPGRSTEFGDWVADVTGALLAQAFLLAYWRWRRHAGTSNAAVG